MEKIVKKTKKIQTTIFVILQLHCYGKTPGKKTIVNPKREKITARKEEGRRRSAPERGLFPLLFSSSAGLPFPLTGLQSSYFGHPLSLLKLLFQSI